MQSVQPEDSQIIPDICVCAAYMKKRGPAICGLSSYSTSVRPFHPVTNSMFAFNISSIYWLFFYSILKLQLNFK